MTPIFPSSMVMSNWGVNMSGSAFHFVWDCATQELPTPFCLTKVQPLLPIVPV
jgi:hypothetical protein